ncbi:acyl-ACP--UDP-N-acetylglucosamine O-acyltransferase [Ectothiorhodospiraceae bacterium 2226]|nr:acyl-ACP--UDP-N-acetylglucosamine O-acyltransferase [Ectothiorhodospiraceae bacterium 2226]
MIHPSALVDSAATLGANVTVGPFSVIGPDVEIGEGTWIGPHVVISGPCRIGRENRIFQFCSVGEVPQDKKFAGEDSRLEIGDRNVIREGATLHRGTGAGGGLTCVGDDNLLMAYVHVAHDCKIGNSVIMANNASLAGHVTLGDYAILGGFTLVHQFCAIGAHSFSAMGSAISKDVPPYTMVAGNPAEPHGLNSEGLKRRGFSVEVQRALRQAYRVLYRSGLGREQALAQMADLAQAHPEVALLHAFVRDSKRSIVR